MPSNLLRDEVFDGRVTHTGCLSRATSLTVIKSSEAAVNDGSYIIPKWSGGWVKLCFLTVDVRKDG